MTRAQGAQIVGREAELAALRDFLGAGPSGRALVLSGGPGIGKTTLWEAGIEAALGRGLRVLRARPSSAETQLSFAALGDLLDDVDAGALTGVPAPQLRALRVALLRAEPRGRPPEPRAIALGFLNALRTLATHEPLLVAVDDIQWLDRPSAEALTFTARRLEDDTVGFLLAKRPGSPSALERGFEPSGCQQVEIGPLSLGAIRRMLSERLGLSLPRRVLHRVYDVSEGNPLFALEIGRTLVERGAPKIGEEIPLPEALEDVLGTRVGRLPKPMRRLLLAVALSADLRASQIAAIAGDAAVEDAVDAGLLVVDGERGRPSPVARYRGGATIACTGAAGAPPRAGTDGSRRAAARPSPRARNRASRCRACSHGRVGHFAGTCLERIREAETWARDSLPAACDAGPRVERLLLHGLAWVRVLTGHPVDDLDERFRAASDDTFEIWNSVDRLVAIRLAWRGEVSEARASLTRLLALADERGELFSYLILRLHLCELELRAGEWEAASRLLDDWAESSDRELMVAPSYERCRAMLAAGRGLAEETEPWAAPALAGSEATGARWQLFETLRAEGIAALVSHEPARAVENLLPVWTHAQREGIDDPGALPVAPDLVEALAELGELEQATAVADRLRRLAEEQQHPWGLVTARRCDAVLRLASQTYDELAAASLAQAAVEYEQLGLRFDTPRSLLSLGRAQRRHRKWGAARHSLEQAVAGFDEIGSPGWADEARAELARVGARRPGRAGELTPTERRVVELAAEGLSNKEIASSLFVTVHTVEVHLSHAYAKLGIRSRAQLAGRLSAAQ